MATLHRAELGERVDAAPRTDDELERQLAQLRDSLGQRAVDALEEESLARAIDRLRAAEVRLEEAYSADRKRHRKSVPPLIEIRELGRASADVDEQCPAVRERQPADDRELDDARFLDSLDDLELDAGLASRPLDERRTVRGFTHRARSRGAVCVDLRGVHGLPEVAEGRARLTDRCGGEAASDEHLATEAHGRAEARHFAEGRRGLQQERELLASRRWPIGFDNTKTQGVRAEVERCEARHSRLLSRVW